MRIDTPNTTPAGNCGRCRHFSLPAGEKLSKHGFGRCTHMPVWRTPSTEARCDFTPSRFAVRTP